MLVRPSVIVNGASSVGSVNGGAVHASSVTPGSFYEIATVGGSKFLRLKRFLDFSRVSRTIAAADSEFGWTWDNRSEVISANEDNAVSNACRLNASATLSDWFAGPYSAARRYKTFAFDTSCAMAPRAIIARISNNASTAYTGFGIQITESGTNSAFLRYQVGFGAATEKIISYLSTAAQETALNATQLGNGVWLRITFFDGNAVLDYNFTVQTTPPTVGWVRDRTVTFVLDPEKTYEIGLIQIVNAVASGLQSNVLYYDDTELTNGVNAASNPVWGAQGYDTSNTEVQIIDDFDLVSDSAVINIDALKAALSDAVNSIQYDAAAWTFQVKQSATVGATTSGAFSTIETLSVSGSGRYLSLWAKANSDGTQAGSIRFPLQILAI